MGEEFRAPTAVCRDVELDRSKIDSPIEPTYSVHLLEILKAITVA